MLFLSQELMFSGTKVQETHRQLEDQGPKHSTQNGNE